MDTARRVAGSRSGAALVDAFGQRARLQLHYLAYGFRSVDMSHTETGRGGTPDDNLLAVRPTCA